MSDPPPTEHDVSRLLSVAEAVAIIDAVPVHPRSTTMPLADAEGLRLAADLRADRDYPPFDKALMDGYAVRADDLEQIPADLRLAGEIPAGYFPTPDDALDAGETLAIMTGAPLPPGADTVVPVEDTQRLGEIVRILQRAKTGRNISARGADVRKDQPLLNKGTSLNAAQIAVAGSIGAARVAVFERPRVAVLTTGDELVPIDQTAGPAQIRNSNNLMLATLLRKFGCAVNDLGTAPDDPETLRYALAAGLQHDCLFVTGGMSMGAYDFVPRILQELRVDLRITKLRIKPGKPFLFGVAEGYNQSSPAPNLLSYVFGLPGNPVSTFVCTVRLASRLITRLSGGAPTDNFLIAPLLAPLPSNGPREFYQPAILNSQGVQPLAWKGSADIYTLATANALLVRPENDPPREPGATVTVIPI